MIMVEEENKETSREKFVRLATKRTQAIIEKIRILGNCSNEYLYQYNEEDVKKIFKAIDEELKTTKAKFLPRTKINKFTLKK